MVSSGDKAYTALRAMTRRLIVIGAGPIGLQAALAASDRGFAVTVLEKGQVGDALRRWGPTRLFSPMKMNLSSRARDIVQVGDDELLTGPEAAERVLLPLAKALSVKLGHRVISVGRARMRKDEMAGHPLRAERNFQLLVETPEGERLFEAEVVLDASGVFDQPLWMGAGGLPAVGERALGDRVIRHLGEMHRRDLAEKRVLLVGHGHSAAHAIDHLIQVKARVVWAIRAANARPVTDVAGDPLPERARIVARANAVAAAPPPGVTIERRAHVEAIGPELEINLSGGREHAVDEIVSLTGYRPDLSMLSELAIEIAPATEGAGRLYRAVSCVTDCLSVPQVAPRDLESGEPGFALIGAKSYGRSRTFLLQTGLAQLDSIFACLG
jgi:thioredoxin reductase